MSETFVASIILLLAACVAIFDLLLTRKWKEIRRQALRLSFFVEDENCRLRADVIKLMADKLSVWRTERDYRTEIERLNKCIDQMTTERK